MSRSGYMDDVDCDFSNIMQINWRGAVCSAMRGKRGQAFLKEALAVLEAMPVKRLITEDLEKDGEVCFLGAVGKARGIDMSKLDPEDSGPVADTFGIADAMARELVYMNDEANYLSESPEARYERMLAWVKTQIKE